VPANTRAAMVGPSPDSHTLRGSLTSESWCPA